jgi:hypothetical protein
MVRVCSTHGEKRNVYRVFLGKPERKRKLEDLNLDGRIILKWILEKYDWLVLNGLI